MKCKIPEISWHNRDPVLSVDIQPRGVNGTYRLASSGTDSHVLIWHLSLVNDGSDIELDLAADLSRHQRAVNTVKWSPNGNLLASGDDESVVFIWKQKAESEPLNILDNSNEEDKEVWITLKVLRGHMEDIYDLSWSPNSLYLVSGSVDNTAVIWDVHKGKPLSILNDHKGFVQGVAWDPKNQFIATLSTDRYLRIFDIQTKRIVHRINKCILPVPQQHELSGKKVRLFHDDTLQTFFRRLCFTPDGKLLITPSGVTDYDGVTQPMHTSYVFSRYSLRQPSFLLPCPDQYTVAVSCCPLLFKLRPHHETNPPIVALPYRMIFVVATRSSVYFYDTQQPQPFALISNIHYTRLTDVTWSSDGRIVVVSSTDGFCSLITFEKGELGEEYEHAQAVLEAVLVTEQTNTKKSKKQKENDSKTRKPSIDGAVREKTSEIGNKDLAVGSAKMPVTKSANPITSRQTNNDVASTIDTSNTLPKSVDDFGMVRGVISTLPKPVISSEIFLDKEILSSEEKFESPEKKSRPVTPISVRRHPRSGSINNDSPVGGKLNLTPRQGKGVTPIAIRRTPRAIIPDPCKVDATNLAEEAMDGWPLETTIKSSKISPINVAALIAQDKSCDRTEDIRLVYEDTVEEIEKQGAEETNVLMETEQKDTNYLHETQQTPNNKTPRRVALKTISTPKSKKKII